MRKYMRMAIDCALDAYAEGEVPVGAVIVKENSGTEEVIAKCHNLCKAQNSPLYHAEMQAINKATEILNTPILKNCTLYVTLEPCPMCAGAIIHSGISKVVFGAYDTDFGAFGSYINLGNHSYAKSAEIYGGICEKECSELIKSFFKEIRYVKH